MKSWQDTFREAFSISKEDAVTYNRSENEEMNRDIEEALAAAEARATVEKNYVEGMSEGRRALYEQGPLEFDFEEWDDYMEGGDDDGE